MALTEVHSPTGSAEIVSGRTPDTDMLPDINVPQIKATNSSVTLPHQRITDQRLLAAAIAANNDPEHPGDPVEALQLSVQALGWACRERRFREVIACAGVAVLSCAIPFTENNPLRHLISHPTKWFSSPNFLQRKSANKN